MLRLINSSKTLSIITKSFRKSQKLSQSDIADLVGLKQSTVSSFETNPGATKLDTLFRILSAENLDLYVKPKNSKDNKDSWKEEW